MAAWRAPPAAGLAWMWERIDAGLKQAFRQHPKVRAAARAEQHVRNGQLAASTAARTLLAQPHAAAAI
jgi:LAO/AO transport system kinase